jgi:hypothetical protein
VEASVRQLDVPRRVEVRGGGVFIDGLLVEDRTLVDLVARRLERDLSAEETVVDALEIGARVLDREATAAEVDFVRREFERVSTEVERSFTERAHKAGETLEQQLERFLGEENGVVSKALEAHVDELAELVAEHFGADRNTAVQHQLRELLGKMLGESRQELLRQFSAEDGYNPLADLKASVVREVKRAGDSQVELVRKLTSIEGELKRLRDAQEARAQIEAEREVGTRKGREFEQSAFDLIDRIAVARGDVAHHVGDRRSESGGKRGDVVIEIDAASGKSKGRIAIDAKDEKLSKPEAWRVLDGALAERDARFAILVVASDDKVPAGREQLQEYEGNKMIVTLDRETFDSAGLELAYRYARCRCLMAVERELEIDAGGVRDAAEEALSALKDAQRIRASLTGARNSVEGAREALDAMIARVEASLARVEALIAPAQDG